ncbi:MAG: hypothetical protein APR53_08230 [Methanoculleus sp. SDB]|nr:MAG: hypothetical protein APR53_08230 [Methanoculleus sp. SDB]
MTGQPLLSAGRPVRLPGKTIIPIIRRHSSASPGFLIYIARAVAVCLVEPDGTHLIPIPGESIPDIALPPAVRRVLEREERKLSRDGP